MKAATNGQLTLVRLETKIDAVLREIERSRRDDFVCEFPLGYTILTLVGGNSVVPVSGPRPLIADWRQLSMTIRSAHLDLALPRIQLGTNRPGAMVEATFVRIDRKVGAEFQILFNKSSPSSIFRNNTFLGGGQFIATPNPDTVLSIRLVESREFGYVLLLGLKPLVPKL